MYKPVITRKEVNDEHYYYVDGEFRPSVTKILHESMPMPVGLKMWIGDMGNEKAEQKLKAAGDRGTILHQTCEALLSGHEVDITSFDRKDQKCLVAFVNWFADFQPYDIELEQTVASKLGYAGTLDIKCKIKPEFLAKNKVAPQIETDWWIIDIKTSRGIYTEHKLQITAYEQANFEMSGEHTNRGILHLNPLTKKGYAFDIDMRIENKTITVDDFVCVLNMYKMLNGGVIPEPQTIESYPEKLKISNLVA